MKVFLASANAKKILEMQRILAEHVPDIEVLGIGDQFLFGPSLLVSPVTKPGATSRSVYLPRRHADRSTPSNHDGCTPPLPSAGARRRGLT